MCTIGAIKISDDEVVLFKNKDFADRTFQDELICTEQCFGARGLETFDVTGESPVFSGLSVAANQYGLLACVNHVKAVGVDALNYDILVENVIERATSVDSAISCIKQAVEVAPFWWGNIVVASTEQLAVIEIRGQECLVSKQEKPVFRTNHQPLYGETHSPDKISCSATRFQSIESRIKHIQSVNDVLTMLCTHDNANELSGICNHGALSTVYSYVLHRTRKQTRLFVVKGSPCENKWQEFLLPLGDDWSEGRANELLAQYPN